MEPISIYRKLSSRLASVFFIAPIVFLFLFILFDIFCPKISHSINRSRWEREKPKTYYLRVHAFTSFGCSWTWEAIVKDKTSTLLTKNTFHPNEKGISCSDLEWFLDENQISIDHIFDVLEKTCINRGFLDCASTFDAKYHYPRQSESYETYVIEIEQFINCDLSLTSCP